MMFVAHGWKLLALPYHVRNYKKSTWLMPFLLRKTDLDQNLNELSFSRFYELKTRINVITVSNLT